MQKIVSHMWFDTEARQAVEFYVGAFKDLGESKILHSQVLHDTPSGNAEMLTFMLAGSEYMAISAGPYFKVNPAISFMVNFDPSRDPKAREHLDELWNILSEGGTALMELGEYPFSKHYGWIQDKFGVSWQLILTNPEGEERPLIIPSLMFVGSVCGKAEEATDRYLSIFKNSKRGTLARYPAGREPDKEGSLMFTDFMLERQWFAAMDSAYDHKFGFNEAISLVVRCNTQEEIDFFWEKLSAVPEAEQCGWLKDVYGVSWQIVPRALDEMMSTGTPEQIARVTQAFLQMKKFDIKKLEEAFGNEK